jgi:hypothetical protein
MRRAAIMSIVFLNLPWAMSMAAPANGTFAASMDPNAAARFAGLALKCLHDEYPSHISLTMDGDADARPPRELTPAFYGCFDWHSDVHGHWLLVRLLPDAPFAAKARAALARSFTAENISGELDFLKRPGRASFERPYGLAWLLRLCAELREWQDPQAQQWLIDVLPRPKGRGFLLQDGDVPPRECSLRHLRCGRGPFRIRRKSTLLFQDLRYL